MWDEKFEKTLRASLRFLDPVAPLDPEAPMADLGLDSMATVGLLVALEQEFDVTFPDATLTTETFADAQSLWSVVTHLVDEKTSASR